MRVDPNTVLERALTDLPEGGLVTAAVVLVEYIIPGEDDDTRRGPYLAWRRDTVAGRWTHLGMIEAFAVDLRSTFLDEDADDD